MNNKLIVSVIAAAVVFGGGGYYFGMQAGASQAAAARTAAFGGGAGGNFAGRAGGAGRIGGGAAFGTIVAKDATSITVQLTTGTSTSGTGSKIVLYDTTTQIEKMVAGSGKDLSVGTNVVVNGTANSDGSITAQTIQIRPVGTGPRGQ